jgi:hypothetical protein
MNREGECEAGLHIEEGELQIGLMGGMQGDGTSHDWCVPTEGGDQPKVEGKAEPRRGIPPKQRKVEPPAIFE